MLRADYVRPAETCKKDPDGIFFGLKAAIKTRIYTDARKESEIINCIIAHILRFKPDMPLEPYNQKTYGLYPFCHTMLYSEQGTEKYGPQPISARFDLCRKAKKVRFTDFFACFGWPNTVRAMSY